MRTGPVPDWDPSGLMPPSMDSFTSPGHYSPYHIGLTDLVLRFGSTLPRRKLLGELLHYRASFHNAGIEDGFQWLNGSFVEDVETHSNRSPNDIDVVTFFHLPVNQTQEQLLITNPFLSDLSLLDPTVKNLDAYLVVLEESNLPYLIRRVSYWHSLWSHTRNFEWKGYVEIDLSAVEDNAARATLEQATMEEAGE